MCYKEVKERRKKRTIKQNSVTTVLYTWLKAAENLYSLDCSTTSVWTQ